MINTFAKHYGEQDYDIITKNSRHPGGEQLVPELPRVQYPVLQTDAELFLPPKVPRQGLSNGCPVGVLVHATIGKCCL